LEYACGTAIYGSVGVDVSLLSVSGIRGRGRIGVALYRRRCEKPIRHQNRRRPFQQSPTFVGGTDQPSTAADSAASSTDPAPDTHAPGDGRPIASSGRRRPGSTRLGFQYPDVFGRRRARGGATARRTIASGRLNFLCRAVQPPWADDVTSGAAENLLPVSCVFFLSKRCYL